MDQKTSVQHGRLCIIALIIYILPVSLGRGLLTVDPGLFVISGVGTCGNGSGYCLLGLDCTLDQDFLPDDENGHCDGLKSAFTPSANFVCCKDSNKTDTSDVIYSKKKPDIKPIPISMLPGENENEIENVISKIVESINSSLSNDVTTNKTRDSQPSKQVDNYNGFNNNFRDSDKNQDEIISEIDNNSKRDITEESPHEEYQITTTEFSPDLEIMGMTENTENRIERDKYGQFDEVSLKSDEVYSKEEPSRGDAEWLSATRGEHQTNYDGVKKTEDNIVSNDNNEVNSMIGEENSGFIKTGNVVENERDQGQMGDTNNSNNSEVVTDNVQNTESGILNADVTVNNQFDVTNPPTDAVTIEPATVKIGDNFHHPSGQRPDKSKDPDPDSSSKAEDSTEPKTDDNPTEKPCGMSARCIGLVRFMFDSTPLCYGNPLHEDWIVTSAACALRIFRMGMFNVSVLPEEDTSWSKGARIRTIIVHENYRTMENELHLEVNNIGLLRIYPGLGWDLCRACLPQTSQKFEGERCATHPIGMPPQPSRLRYSDHIRVGALCEGNTEVLPGAGGFLSLPCKQSAWIPRAVPNSTPSIGLPLRCDGILAGVQAAEGVGTRVYTPLSPFLDWIQLNTRPAPLPTQTFRRLEQ